MVEKTRIKPYGFQIKVFATIFATLLLATLYCVFVSMASDPDGIPGTSVVSFLYLSAWAYPILVLFGGIGHAVATRSRSAAHGWFNVSVGIIPAVFVFYSFASDCDVAASINKKMLAELTTSELTTLHTEAWVCPTVYTYEKDGSHEKLCVIGLADIIHGPQVNLGSCG